uniref:SH3 domain-containing protein n=1 Tax=Parascaris equorum TaxID=6256 RepID=A0A914SKN1_PAREQ
MHSGHDLFCKDIVTLMLGCSNPEEKVYADWDCPQAAAVHKYTASQEDELSLEKGDLINILRKMPDGLNCCTQSFGLTYLSLMLQHDVTLSSYVKSFLKTKLFDDFRSAIVVVGGTVFLVQP